MAVPFFGVARAAAAVLALTAIGGSSVSASATRPAYREPVVLTSGSTRSIHGGGRQLETLGGD